MVKRGDGVSDQGRYCVTLGDSVVPRVLYFEPDGYAMELLSEPTIADPVATLDVLQKMRTLLSDTWRLWTPRTRRTEPWNTQLVSWLSRNFPEYANVLTFYLREMYHDDEWHRDAAIHGDPTLANVLLKDGEVRIADPLAPKGKIPGLPEVDAGKMLQSVIGWEYVACGWSALFRESGVRELAQQIVVRELNDRRCQFWLLIHVLRIIPYARSDLRVQDWAKEQARSIYTDLMKGVSLCDTLSTSTELSLTHATQFSRRTATSA